MIDAARRRLDDEARPQGLVAIEQAARRPVPQRNERHRYASRELDPVVPVEGLHGNRRIMGAHHRVIAERRDDARPVHGGEPRERGEIEMVVVAVRHQHGVDCGQRLECDPGIVDPLRSGKAHRRGALRPYRIAQEVDARGLYEKRRMADESDPDRVSFDPGRRVVREGARHPFRPLLAAARPLPAQDVDDAPRRRAMGIAKTGAVEVVGHRSFVVAGEQRAGKARAEQDRRGTGDPCEQVATRWRHNVLHSGLAAARLTA